MGKTRAQLIRMMALNQAFNPADLTSRPTTKQDEVLKDVWSRHKYVIAGNQCLAEGTLIRTSEGNKPIQDVQVGDTVYDENGNPIKVLKTFKNGIKKVRTLTNFEHNIKIKATKDHVFLTDQGEKKVSELTPHSKIKRVLEDKTVDYLPVDIALRTSPNGLVPSEVETVTYDIHVDSPTNLYCLANGLVTHNSGKSQTKARDVAWKLTETHPYWQRPNSKRCMNKLCESNQKGAKPDFGITISNRLAPKGTPPKIFKRVEDYVVEDGDDMANAIYSCNKCKCKWMDWKQEPLTLVVGSKTSQLTGEMWDKKILPFLEGVKIRVEKAGHAVKKVINIDPTSPGQGNEILFFSHDNAKQASARMQGITVHDVWLDELPDSWKLVEELHQRTAARRSQFCATFTPKTPNPEVRRIIDESDRSIVSVYRFGMLDNPAYANRREEQLKTLEGLSEAMKRCILYGDWLDGDEKVFLFTKEQNVIDGIRDYDPSWPHVLSVDPAMSMVGWSVACWSPIEERWFVIRAEYLKADKSEDSPKTLIAKLEQKVSKYNIVRRIYDCHETWWMTTAREEFGLRYIPVRKDKRKKELLVNLIKAVGERKFLFVGDLKYCYDELHRAEWHPDKDHVIRNATNYHIIDSLQYLLDLLPKNVEGIKKPLTYDQELYTLHKKEKKMKEEVAKAQGYEKVRKIRKLLKFRRRHRGGF